MAANVFNWIIAGTDAHAKNYALLLGAQGEVRLAPFYDISSILPHLGEGEIQAEMRDLKLAMKIDRVYPIDEVMPCHWERCASSAKVGGEDTMRTIRHQLAVIPDMASECARELHQEGIPREIVGRLVDAITTRTKGLSRIYGEDPAAQLAEVQKVKVGWG